MCRSYKFFKYLKNVANNHETFFFLYYNSKISIKFFLLNSEKRDRYFCIYKRQNLPIFTVIYF